MSYFLPLVLGFCIAFVAVILPGLINMTAAKISLQEGRNEALSFAAGASVVVFFQTFIAVLFARFISNHQEIVTTLQEIGIFVFSLLSIYFFWIAKKPKKPKTNLKIKGKSNRFFFGMLLSTLNLLPIPFYVFASMGLSAAGYFSFDKIPVSSFVTGVVLGSFVVFYIYIVAFKKIEKKTEFMMQNINTIIGSVTTFMAVVTLLKLLYE
ncbi:lysine transporter LysE [Flavobacterium silvisoli]|uniref:Lysine transporter LysE n=1 Tax=Flavobacterium silvisoli TaxID=2529433 RepID=A0A4Q9Z7I8_9FLAO|nr:LysE family transporter [Flavobacterium silvisoli]TBX70655.1 lysine transporter LysE [Flavobacterium silvisoli]